MANSSVDVATQRTTRELLASFAGNQRLIKLFENLAQDAGTTIPAAMDQLQESSDSVRTLAVLVQAIAAEALDLALQAVERPVQGQADNEAGEAPVQAQPIVESIAVNGLYFNTDGVDPALVLGYGAWAAYASGQVLVGYAAADPDFGTPGGSSGAKTHAISAHAGTAVANHADHTHSVTSNVTAGTTVAAAGAVSVVNSITNNAVTSGAPSATLTHTVTQPSDHAAVSALQPSVTVYVWLRTA